MNTLHVQNPPAVCGAERPRQEVPTHLWHSTRFAVTIHSRPERTSLPQDSEALRQAMLTIAEARAFHVLARL